MGSRILLVLAPDAPPDMASAATDAVTDIGRRDRVDVTVATAWDSRFGDQTELAAYSLVHVVGTPTPPLQRLWRDRVPLVVTPVRRPRRGPRLLRRVTTDRTWWLVHGRALAERLTADGVAPSARVLPLPVLPALGVPHADWASQRAASRSALGVSPGSRVVVGMGGLTDGSFDAFRRAVRLLARRDVRALWVATDADPHADAAPDDDIRLTGQEAADGWLPAMDVFAAAGTCYAARSPAVDAAEVGVPVISTAYNVAADFVDLTAGGAFVQPARPAELADALAHALRVAGRRRSRFTRPAGDDPMEELVERTEQCYADALGRPLRATTTLLRGLSA